MIVFCVVVCIVSVCYFYIVIVVYSCDVIVVVVDCFGVCFVMVIKEKK